MMRRVYRIKLRDIHPYPCASQGEWLGVRSGAHLLVLRPSASEKKCAVRSLRPWYSKPLALATLGRDSF